MVLNRTAGDLSTPVMTSALLTFTYLETLRSLTVTNNTDYCDLGLHLCTPAPWTKTYDHPIYKISPASVPFYFDEKGILFWQQDVSVKFRQILQTTT